MSGWVTWRLVVRLVLAGLLAVATEAAGIGLVGTAAWLIVRAADRPPLAALAVAIVAVRALALAKGGLRYAERLASHDAVLRVLADLRARVFAAVATRSAVVTPSAVTPRGAVPTRIEGADALSGVVSDVDGVQDALLRCALPAGVAAVVGTLGVVLFAAVAPVAGAVLAAGLVVGGVLLPLLGYGLSRSAAGRISGRRADLTTATVDLVRGAADLAAFGALPAALDAAAGKAALVARLEARAGSVSSVVGGVASAMPAVTSVAIATLVPGRASGVLALVALAAGEVVVPLAAAAVLHAGLRGSLARIAVLLAGSRGIPENGTPENGTLESGTPENGTLESGTPENGTAAQPLPAVPAQPGWVRVSNVVVRYRDEGPPALDGVDLDLPPGARVAIVGPSGSGKSTLLAAIAGQVPLASGQVTGVRPGWPDVGGVFADAHVFHATVRENLVLGRDWLTDDAARRALAVAGLPEWGDRLGLVVGEDGAEVSGGQRQRLLLARALIEAPPVLMLDEPTEGLDAATADAVLDTALDAAGARTVVVVTHRRAHLRRFDQVIGIEDGRRVPIGDIPEDRVASGMQS
jgi:ATP-binding cassette subfamily C protein CydC